MGESTHTSIHTPRTHTTQHQCTSMSSPNKDHHAPKSLEFEETHEEASLFTEKKPFCNVLCTERKRKKSCVHEHAWRSHLVPHGQPRVLLVVPVLVSVFLRLFPALGFACFSAPRTGGVLFEGLLRRPKLGSLVRRCAVSPLCSCFASSSSSAAAASEVVAGRPACARFRQGHAAVNGHEMTGFN